MQHSSQIHPERHMPVQETYKDVQFSVHIEGLFGELGPLNVSPHLIPLQRTGTNHGIWGIVLLAHHPRNAGLKTNCHGGCPMNICRSLRMIRCFYVSILVLDLTPHTVT